MNNFLIHNSVESSIEEQFSDLSSNCDEIRIAVAFFSDEKLISEWLKRKIKLSVIVSLQPPTTPYLLKKLLPLPISKVEIKFFHSGFHSKLYIFRKNGKTINIVIGSSNFTNGGLSTNIESNVLISDKNGISILEQHFKGIWDIAPSLSPTDVRNYIKYYEEMKLAKKKLGLKIASFDRRFVRPRIVQKKIRINKKAKEYFIFWKRVDEIVELVKAVSKKEYPNVPYYLTVDHFWHWVVKEWDQRGITRLQSNVVFRNITLPKLFKECAEFDKSNENYTNKYLNKRANYFRSLLKPSMLNKLTRKQAKEFYAYMHSGGMRANRFDGHIKFSTENSIEKIRKSLEYLLWSSDDIDKRISILMQDPEYKLSNFGSSNIQELLGWVHPELPLRNDKADKAVKMLGFQI